MSVHDKEHGCAVVLSGKTAALHTAERKGIEDSFPGTGALLLHPGSWAAGQWALQIVCACRIYGRNVYLCVQYVSTFFVGLLRSLTFSFFALESKHVRVANISFPLTFISYP